MTRPPVAAIAHEEQHGSPVDGARLVSPSSPSVASLISSRRLQRSAQRLQGLSSPRASSFRPPSLDAPSQTVTALRGDAEESAYDEANAALSPEMHSSLPLEIYKALTALDDRLVEVLARGDICLVRTEWLLAQPDDYRIERRQALEALEHKNGLSPLLTPAEAVALVRKGTRGVGVASHGWLSAGNPDPSSARMKVLRRALRERRHIEALFFDFASLYQHERSTRQLAAFKRALAVVRGALSNPPESPLPVRHPLPSPTEPLPPARHPCFSLTLETANPRHTVLRADGRPLCLGHWHNGAPNQGDPAPTRRVRWRPLPLRHQCR